MLTQIVEAQSADSMADAVAQAMVKASVFISENSDLRISVLELSAIRKGGYKAVLEVALIPLTQFDGRGKKSDDVEPAHLAEVAVQEKRKREVVDLKTRIIDQFRRRKSSVALTATMDRPQLSEAALISQLEGEYTQKMLDSNLSMPNPGVIVPEHERVDDKVHNKPIDEIIVQEFSHVTHPAEHEVVIKRRALPDMPIIGPDAPREEPQ